MPDAIIRALNNVIIPSSEIREKNALDNITRVLGK
jgi:hypothetical protein